MLTNERLRNVVTAAGIRTTRKSTLDHENLRNVRMKITIKRKVFYVKGHTKESMIRNELFSSDL